MITAIKTHIFPALANAKSARPDDSGSLFTWQSSFARGGFGRKGSIMHAWFDRFNRFAAHRASPFMVMENCLFEHFREVAAAVLSLFHYAKHCLLVMLELLLKCVLHQQITYFQM